MGRGHGGARNGTVAAACPGAQDAHAWASDGVALGQRV
jgi:hypothetical protein